MLCVTSSSFAKWTCPLSTGLRPTLRTWCVRWCFGSVRPLCCLLVDDAHALHRRVLRSTERRLLLRLRSTPVHLQLSSSTNLASFGFQTSRSVW